MERFGDLERKYLLEVLKNGFRTSLNNIFCSKMERLFADLHNVRYAISHANGTQTIHTALASLGVKSGDEVIVPPLTMASTSIAVLHNGSLPVFADVDVDTFNIDPNSIRSRITPKSKAVISVSLYGLPPNYDEIKKVCDEEGLFLIEDNAEALFAEYKGKRIGIFGNFASFSFQASKHITCGEGGMLVTNDQMLADRARRFSSLGYAGVSPAQGKISKDDIQNPNYDRHVTIGYNYRMSELNAAVILGQLERVDELVNQRIHVAKLFDEVLDNQSLLKKQLVPPGYKHTYWSYSVVLDTENPQTDWYRFRELFKRNGGDSFYAAWKLNYFEPLFANTVQHWNRVWQEYKAGLCPNAEYLQPRLIQLKTNYWNLSEAENQAEILYKTIKQF